jgi:hypothetical protein
MALIQLRRPAEKAEQREAPHIVLGVEQGSGSVAGSTYWKGLRMCPREHGLRHVARLGREGDNEALTQGWTFHLVLERYYGALLAGVKPAEAEASAWAAFEPMRDEPGYADTYAEIERMLASYFDHYRGQDDWRIVAVEETLVYQDAGLRYSARLDLLVEEAGGLWIVEHKTAKTIGADLISNYQLDMQILGQVWLLQQCVDLSSYAPLRGVKVNITSKHKPPRHERVEVMPSQKHLDAFERSMRDWHAVEGVYRKLGYPQSLGNCAGAARFWSRCDYYDLCHGWPSKTVDEWGQGETPLGYTRR